MLKRLGLANLKVRTSLLLVMFFFMVMLLAGAALGIFSLRANNQALDVIVTNQKANELLNRSIGFYKDTQTALGRASAAYISNQNNQSYTTASEWVNSSDGAVRKLDDNTIRLLNRVDMDYQRTKMAFDEFHEYSESFEDINNAYVPLYASFEKLLEAVPPLLDLVKQGRMEEFRVHLAILASGAESDMYYAAERLQQFQQAYIDESFEKEEKQYDLVIQLVGVALALCVLICLGVYAFLRSMVLTPLRTAQEHFDRIASGDLTQRIEVTSDNEIGVLSEAVRRMQDSLRKMVLAVRDGVQAIEQGSQEIFQGNTDLSSRTEQQAAALQETAASMEELSSTVRQNADNAQQADRVTHDASNVAERGGQAVAQVVDTMNDIAASSNEIANIVNVIDGIAFQTNILALNAAVEAARAGEQGRGFAVVAGEVRSLAQRSAQAAREVKVLIEGSLQKVNVGARQVDDAGGIMQEVVSSVRGITVLMDEISSASHEQSEGIDQVNQAVSQMDAVVQQNAALVEQAAAAAGSLQSQAAHLMEVVAVFKINSGEIIEMQADELGYDYDDEHDDISPMRPQVLAT